MTSSLGTAVSADGIPVRYKVRGSGEPALVFVHGWSCDRRYWNAQVDYFADRHRVVAVDLAGHGESGLGRSAGRCRASAPTSSPLSNSWDCAAWC